MGHTNSTTNYALPQFITTDKPAWLVDINGAFSDIDTGIHNAQTDATTAGTNASQALLDASAAASAASAADAKGAGACASIEAAFDSTAVYAVGALVMYNSLLYRCNVAVVTPGPWTGSANWERVTVVSLIPTNAGYIEYNEYAVYPSDTVGYALNYKADNSTNFTFSAASGVSVSSVQASETGRLCVLNAECNFTGAANTWFTLGTVNKIPTVAHVTTAGVNSSNGSYMGMVEVRSDGQVRVYPTSAVSNGYVMFNLTYLATV